MERVGAKCRPLACNEPCVFEYRGGVFEVFDPALGFPRAMSVDAFFQTIANAVECARQHRPWDRPSADVISLADHAATGRSSK